jgi:hypothetical protein
MIYYDVFNGDADGICSLHQLRLARPLEAELISGVKRDIRLLERLREVRDAVITVLDISLESNKEDLRRLLATCRIFYADHHFAGEIPESEFLEAHIDSDPETCTGLIIDRLLEGRYRAWAVTAAFGDNLHGAARLAAAPLGLTQEELTKLQELGELLNYNGYGQTVADLHVDPVELYRALHGFVDPLAFYGRSDVLARLREGYRQDMEKARSVAPHRETGSLRVYVFPGESWARRASGVFINEKARELPDKAHALLVDNGNDTATVSVRAPILRRQGADTLCRRFPTGGGRAAAAGINALPAALTSDFLRAFEEEFCKR